MWAAIAVAARILSGLRHRDPLLPVDAVLDELAPSDRERSLRAVAPYIAAVMSFIWRRRGISAMPRRFLEQPSSPPPLRLLLLLVCRRRMGLVHRLVI